jgi:hypothetical protein
MPAEFMKRLLEKGSAATLEHFAKAQIAGRDTGLRQLDWVFAIQKFADLTFPDKLTPQQRFARMLDTPEGKVLFKAMDAAPPPSYEPEPVEKEEPRHIGEHAARLHAEATARQRERAISYPAAVYEVLQKDPKLAAPLREEHLIHALSMMGGGGGVTHTLSVDEAQNLGGRVPSFTTAGDFSRDIAAKKSAEAEIQKLADRYRSDHPTLTSAQAYVHVLTSPQHREIAKRALAVA